MAVLPQTSTKFPIDRQLHLSFSIALLVLVLVCALVDDLPDASQMSDWQEVARMVTLAEVFIIKPYIFFALLSLTLVMVYITIHWWLVSHIQMTRHRHALLNCIIPSHSPPQVR